MLNAITTSVEIGARNDFEAWTKGDLQELLPHEMLIYCTGRIGARGIVIEDTFPINFPVEYIEAIKGSDGRVTSPIVARWLKERRPQLFEQQGNQCNLPAEWIAEFNRFGLRNIAAHGILDPGGTTGSYFSFSRIPGHLCARHALLLRILVPHMHEALVRVIANSRIETDRESAGNTKLTRREKEVLFWLAQGKTNWEIAAIAGRSENTVKVQVRKILLKLDVSNRAQAAAKAVSLGLIAKFLKPCLAVIHLTQFALPILG